MRKELKTIAALLLGGMLAPACSEQAIETSDQVRVRYESFIASTESESETKVYADDQLRVLWNADDRISLFNQYTYNQEYRFDGETGANSGTFTKAGTDVVATGNELPSVYAVYPYSASNAISNDGVLSVTIPSEQQYVAGTFARGMNVMVSATNDQYLKFKNVCGILAVKLYGSGLSVSSIELKGNDNESIAGNAAVTINPGEEPSTVMGTDAVKSVRLVCSPAVTLPSNPDEFKEFWFMLPPMTFQQGFTVTVNGDNVSFTKGTSNPITIQRNTISRMAVFEVQEKLSIKAVPQLQYGGEDAVAYHTLEGPTYRLQGSSSGLADDYASFKVSRLNRAIGGGAFGMGATDIIDYQYAPGSCQVWNYDFAMSGADYGQGSGSWMPLFKDAWPYYDNTFRINYTIQDSQNITLASKSRINLNVTGQAGEADASILVVPAAEELKSFAFCRPNAMGNNTGLNYHELYETAYDAATNYASIRIQYNAGEVNLTDYLCVYMYAADASTGEIDYSSPPVAVSLSDLLFRYPDLKLNMQVVPYAMGDFNTPQDYFCRLLIGDQPDWFFAPCYALDQGGRIMSNQINPAGYEGCSAIGRKPIICVTLTFQSTIVLTGYFKVLIVGEDIMIVDPGSGSGGQSTDEPPVAYPPIDIIVKDFSGLTINAGSEANLQTDWCDFSYGILEMALMTDYRSFRDKYMCYPGTYRMNRYGNFDSTEDYGTIEYIPESSYYSDACNDVFRITVTAEQSQRIANEGGSVTLYKKFGYGNQVYYLGFVVRVQ